MCQAKKKRMNGEAVAEFQREMILLSSVLRFGAGALRGSSMHQS